MDLQKIGLKIREKRLEQGLTQEQLADRLHVTRQAVSKWENGKSIPDPPLFEPLSGILKIRVSELLSEENPDHFEAGSAEPAVNPAEAVESEGRRDARDKQVIQTKNRRFFVLSGVAVLLLVAAVTAVLSFTGLGRYTVREFLQYFFPYIIFFAGVLLTVLGLIGGAFRKKRLILLIPGAVAMLIPLLSIAAMV